MNPICDDADASSGMTGKKPVLSASLSQDEYPPSEDTFFLADYVDRTPRGKTALDVGSGSGYITRLLCGAFETVVGTDINFEVLKSQNPAYRTDNLVCCSGSDAICTKFDLAVCNPPYLATDTIEHVATDGGPSGFPVPSLILKSVSKNIRQGGRFAFVSTTLSDYQRLIRYAKLAGFSDAHIVSRKKLFFEELLLIECVMGNDDI